ncbi:MAG: hypothetical protein M3Y22_08495 [Pseudomonadota bacterium]|nr:hypothetical protein [Pseudomonadota bacterium]
MNPEDNKLKPMGTQSKETMDKAASATKDAIHSTQQSANEAMDKVSDKVDQAAAKVAPAIDKVSDTANAAMAKARETWNDTSGQLREQAQKASDMATAYAKDEPIKAMLIAAATGALLMCLITLMARSRD